MICECVRPVQGGRFFMASPHGGCTAPPACFEHRVPRFDGVVPQHAPAGLWHRWPRRNPAVGEHRNPLGMHGGCIWFELHHLLLLGAHQPAFTAWLFRWFVGGAVSRQRGGATATEDSSAKHLLPERCPLDHDGVLDRGWWAKSNANVIRTAASEQSAEKEALLSQKEA